MSRRFLCVCALLGLAPLAVRGQAAAIDPSAPETFDTFEPTSSPGPRAWAEVDYLLWWAKPVCQPPTTVSIGNPNDPVPGAVGQPGTVGVMGNTRFEFTGASGVRPTVGVWLDADQSLGVMASGILLPRVTTTRTFTPAAGQFTYLNYVSPTGTNEAIPFTIPGVVSGFASESGSTELWGAEINGLAQARLDTGGGWQARGGLLLGGRYMLLRDEVLLRNTQALLAPPFASAVGENRFVTNNQFIGPQIGLSAAAECGRFEVIYTQKLAVGVTRMENTISGGPLVSGSQLVPGSLPGPLLAMPSNAYRMVTERATLLPELNLKARWRLRDNVKLTLGYNFLYWNRIFCPGDLMDRQVNLTQLPQFGPLVGKALPTQNFARTDYFAQGLEVGVQVAY